MAEPHAAAREWDMALDRREFLRTLALAFPDLPRREDSDGVSVGTSARGFRFQLDELPPRRIALLALPRLRVRFASLGLDAAQVGAVLARFELAFRRGGG